MFKIPKESNPQPRIFWDLGFRIFFFLRISDFGFSATRCSTQKALTI